MTTFHIYIGECCREWPLAFGYAVGRCGLCGEAPTYKRDADDCNCPECQTNKETDQ